MPDRPFQAWSTTAINLPEHAGNVVHTDAGARAAGFEAALVAGTTVHAYLTHPIAEAWGTDWLDRGWSELRLLAPVFDTADVRLVPTKDNTIEARVDQKVRATLRAAMRPPQPTERSTLEPKVLERHEDVTIDLGEGLGSYGMRAGDDLELYPRTGRAHPAVWPCIGNAMTRALYVDGPWVHVRSAITHVGSVAADEVVTVRTALIDRFETRAGERVVLDIEASVDGTLVARIEHESIVRLR